MNRTIKIEHNGEITIGTLLDQLLKNYRYHIASLQPRKLAIRIDRIETFRISGTILEKNSQERLYGALILFTSSEGKKLYASSDEKGNSISIYQRATIRSRYPTWAIHLMRNNFT